MQFLILFCCFNCTEIHKVLTKIAKESNGKEIQPWIRACENHLSWSATSTYNGSGSVIWATFKSFLSHIIDKHDYLDDPLFTKCAHGDIPHREWLNKSKHNTK